MRLTDPCQHGRADHEGCPDCLGVRGNDSERAERFRRESGFGPPVSKSDSSMPADGINRCPYCNLPGREAMIPIGDGTPKVERGVRWGCGTTSNTQSNICALIEAEVAALRESHDEHVRLNDELRRERDEWRDKAESLLHALDHLWINDNGARFELTTNYLELVKELARRYREHGDAE